MLRSERQRASRSMGHERCSSSLCASGAPRGRVMPMDESSIQIGVGRSGSWRAAWQDDLREQAGQPGRSLATKAALGGRAKRRAVTRVHPEHASKVELWTPTLAEEGEGSTGGEEADTRTRTVHRGNGDSTPRRYHGQRGRSVRVRPRPQRRLGRRLAQKSGGVVVPGKPGNSGGGKDPDFGCACAAAEER
jgi:hypothetical protein